MSLVGEALTLLNLVSSKMTFKVKGRVSGKKQRVLTIGNRLKEIADSLAHLLKLALDAKEKTKKCYKSGEEVICNICTNWWVHESNKEVAVKRLKYMTVTKYSKGGVVEFYVDKSKIAITPDKYTLCYEELCVDVPVGDLEFIERRVTDIMLILRKVEGEVHNSANALEKCLKSLGVIT